MNAGRLRDMIRFDIRVIEVVNGQNVPRWVESFNEAAEAVRTSETTASFAIRYNFRGITPATHRIIWDGVIWNIGSIIHDQKRTMFTIDCHSADVEVTHMTSTEREYIAGLAVVAQPEE